MRSAPVTRALFSFGVTGLLVSPGLAWGNCGNGTVDAGEECDDTNISSGDGCDTTCLIEDGYECTDASFELLTAEVLLDDRHHNSPNWTLSSDNLTVTQSVNADSAVYASTLPANGVSITFEVTVNTTSDDDFVGWVVGYNEGDNVVEDANWLLFDWKQNDQVLDGCPGYAGLAMSEVSGPINSTLDVWCHQENVTEIARGDYHGYTGWTDNQTYTIQVDYSTSYIDVYVDGVLEISESGIFPAGTFGFYNYSQQDIEYTLLSPLDQSVCTPMDSDLDGLTDFDEDDIGTDASEPDTDYDGLDDFDEYSGVTDPLDPDSDDDGLSDGDEQNTLGTDPMEPDSDGDGLYDGDEVNLHGTDPNNADDADQSCGTPGTVGSDWLEELAALLPDDCDVGEALLTDDLGYLCITADDVGTTLDFTFVSESATYDNQFGYFLFDAAELDAATDPEPADLITAQGTLFGNTSLTYDGGTCMEVGDTISLTLTSDMVGQSMGFWLRPDGYNSPAGERWYSVDALNDDTPQEHAVIAQSSSDDTLFIGFEDQRRDCVFCSHDFNDLVIAVEADAAGTLEDCLAVDLPVFSADTDGDGVPDGFDDFPDDADKAVANTYPVGGRLQTVAFEDLYPSVGDGDYNDLVVGMRSTEVLNADNEVVLLRGTAVVIARGAARDHEFHLNLPGSGSGTWKLTRYDGDGVEVSSDSGTTTNDADLTLIESTKEALPAGNTHPGKAVQRGWRVVWTFEPDTALTYDALGEAPYDPYLYVLETGYDIHLPIHSPVESSTSPDTDFLDENGYPWALSMPYRWQPPEERRFIEDATAYPDFVDWRTSEGVSNTDWYETAGAECVSIPSDFYDAEVQ